MLHLAPYGGRFVYSYGGCFLDSVTKVVRRDFQQSSNPGATTTISECRRAILVLLSYTAGGQPFVYSVSNDMVSHFMRS